MSTTKGYILSGSSVNDRYANGMSILYHLKDGSFLVYDGGNSSVGELLYKTLKDLSGGEVKVAAWVMTHAHGDHFGALHYMLDHGLTDIEIKEIWFNKADGIGEKLLAKWAECLPNTPVRSFTLGEKATVDEVEVEVICTPDKLLEYDPNAFTVTDGSNNAGIVTMLTIAGKTILMSGDIGPIGWNYMMEHKDEHPIKCDYLQISHHGVHNSGTDEAYAEIDAKYLVIPAGLSLAKEFTLETNKNVSAQASFRAYKKHGIDMTYSTETDGKTYWFAGVYGNPDSVDVKCFFEA